MKQQMAALSLVSSAPVDSGLPFMSSEMVKHLQVGSIIMSQGFIYRNFFLGGKLTGGCIMHPDMLHF